MKKSKSHRSITTFDYCRAACDLHDVLTKDELNVLKDYSWEVDPTEPGCDPECCSFFRAYRETHRRTKLSVATVAKINKRLRELKIIDWVRGHGSGSRNGNGTNVANTYSIDLRQMRSLAEPISPAVKSAEASDQISKEVEPISNHADPISEQPEPFSPAVKTTNLIITNPLISNPLIRNKDEVSGQVRREEAMIAQHSAQHPPTQNNPEASQPPRVPSSRSTGSAPKTKEEALAYDKANLAAELKARAANPHRPISNLVSLMSNARTREGQLEAAGYVRAAQLAVVA